MTRVILCDKCGTIMKSEEDSFTIWVKPTVYEDRSYASTKSFHLCEKCKKVILEFLVSNKENEEMQ